MKLQEAIDGILSPENRKERRDKAELKFKAYTDKLISYDWQLVTTVKGKENEKSED
jgi:hypothetical protein